VQTAEPFDPSDEEIERARGAARKAAAASLPMHLRVSAVELPASAIDKLKDVLESFPGPAEFVLEMETSSGLRRLRLGPSYRVAPTPMLRAELEQILGPAVMATG
jgi:hypothetical protein